MSKLWGGRFSAEPDKQMQLLNDSIGFDKALAEVDIRGSMAYAKALAQADIITDEESHRILDGLEKVLAEFQTGNFEFLPGDEDIHTAVERRLGDLIGDVAGKLHTGRSRNDQVATDIRLWLRDACQQIQILIQAVQQSLIQSAEPHLETVMPGYTHLQPAQPVTVAHWLMSFFWMLERDKARFRESGNRINISPLGAGALSGTPYPIDRKSLAADLDFQGVTMNSLDAVSDRDGIAEFMFSASLLMAHVSRLAEDVLMFSNPAYGFIKLPDAYSTGSSLMPQKRNADPMELIRGKTGRITGNLTGFLTTLKGLPSGYNKDLQEDKEPLFDTFHTLEIVLSVLSGMIPLLKFVPEKMRAALDEGMLATELADYLVKKGIPFRTAHHLVGQVVQQVELQNCKLSELSLKIYQGISPHFDHDVFDWLNFDAAVKKRLATGGTSPESVKKQISIAKNILEG